MLNLNEIAEGSLRVSNMRQSNGSSMTKDNLKHCAEEIIEATESRSEWKHNVDLSRYSYISTEDLEMYKNDFADELMDIVVCVLVECAENDINIEEALKKCVSKNQKRALGIGDKL